ncbi:MAG: hypothetical protein HOP14_15685, partial [Acidobacteria bacterium]|nr:hypothetical protein [Acidobacteriota bacterium]
IGTGGDPALYARIVQDAIVAVGGAEMGVLDENGQQLNPRMAGAGYVSLSGPAVEEIAREMVTGETITFAEIFKILMGSIELPPSVPAPTLTELIAAFQEKVNEAWANPSGPDAPLIFLLFNQGRVASAAPPVVNFDTPFNPLQKNVLATTFAAAVHRYFIARIPSEVRLDEFVPSAPARRDWMAPVRALAGLLRRGSSLGGDGRLSGSIASGWRAPGVSPWRPGTRVIPSQNANPYLPPDAPADRPASLLWGAAMEKVLPNGGWDVAKQLGKPCDDFLVSLSNQAAGIDGKSPEGKALAADPNAKFYPAPSCKDAISLLQILLQNSPAVYVKAEQQFTKFFMSEKATAANAQRLQQQFRNQSFQNAWAEAKQEAKRINQTQKLVGFASGFVQGYVSKVQGQAVDFLLNWEADLLIQSLRPRQPFITSVAQVQDVSVEPSEPSRLITITFARSPNDKAEVNPDVRWLYELYRRRSGPWEIVRQKEFLPGVPGVFHDEVPEDGAYAYTVVGIRLVGKILPEAKKEEPTFASKVLAFLGGFLPQSYGPIGLGVVKTVGDPLAKIYRGINRQISDFSDPAFINVSTKPPVAPPPANLAVSALTGDAFLSIPSLNRIFRISEGGLEPFASPNFKTPNQAGLAVDGLGNVFTDNSASDAQFGGRVFMFDRQSGARQLAGTVNYYSFLLQHANPVSVQAMHIAHGGGLGDILFIADGLNQRITQMTIPFRLASGVTAERNVSQPYAQSPLFAFDSGTALALGPDLRMAVTQGNGVLLVGALGSNVTPLFEPGTAPSPFIQLSGATYDSVGNLYLSDLSLGTVTMIPKHHIREGAGLQGTTAVDRKKLTVIRGLRRPADVKLAGNRRGVVFYDAERALVSVAFGMSGQVTDAAGAPLAGAEVYISELKRVAVTDVDGVFVLPDLLPEGASPVVDFQVRANGRTQSYSVVLDALQHNLIDVEFDPVDPVAPGRDEHPDPVPVPGPNPVTTKPSSPETVSVLFDLAAPPRLEPESCPRGAFLAPAFGAGTVQASVTVTGLLLTDRFESVVLVVNGAPQHVALVDREFTRPVGLLVGENRLTLALPASVLKPIGCADPDLADATLVDISTVHTVFHSPNPALLAQYREQVGFDLAVRGVVRTNGRPAAGLTFHVPGTDAIGVSDGDGAFQVNLPSEDLAGTAAAADVLATEFFNRVAGIVVLLRAEQRAEALDALRALLLQAATIEDNPPGAAETIDQLVGHILSVRGVTHRLIQDLESDIGIPADADVDALELLGQQLAGTDSEGNIVVRGREYPELTITVEVGQ